MGRIKTILSAKKIKNNILNNRFTVELCENVHVHYRNLRLEFSKEEFSHLLKLLNGLNLNKIDNFEYGNYVFNPLISDFGIPETTFFDDRLQIEEQENGIFHVHYRNLRIELENLSDFNIKIDKGRHSFGFGDFWRKLRKLAKVISILLLNKTEPIEKIIGSGAVKIDGEYIKLSGVNHRQGLFQNFKLKNLRVILFTKEGKKSDNIYNSPAFAFLEGNEKEYADYCAFKDQFKTGDFHSIARYRSLIESVSSKGFDKKNVIILNSKNEIIDGQHRACLLLKKFGPEHRVKVLKVFSEGYVPHILNLVVLPLNLFRCAALAKVNFLGKKQHYAQKSNRIRSALRSAAFLAESE
ncbi:MAG: hypothetical protein LBI56_02265 [Puniceicoccales bacterium]|jgi:hypothetical protein|nr:hypothetical protein [Puniceicoccales bacterium]